MKPSRVPSSPRKVDPARDSSGTDDGSCMESVLKTDHQIEECYNAGTHHSNHKIKCLTSSEHDDA